ncbi:MAG: hypothetical protein IJN90_06760 [Bacilli bacterium]|nr:hypothetical protein [Bacilli bacterium]
MFKNLKREVIYKSTVGKELVKAILSAILFTLLFYLCLTDFNREIVDVFLSFQELNVSAFDYVMLILPIFIIIFVSIHLGRLVMLDAFPKKEEKKEVKTKKKKASKK